MRKKFFHYCLLNIMAILFLLLAGPEALAAGKAKNVIVLIVDGCSSEQYTFARWFNGKPLALDAIQVGAVKTYVARTRSLRIQRPQLRRLGLCAGDGHGVPVDAGRQPDHWVLKVLALCSSLKQMLLNALHPYPLSLTEGKL